MLDQTQAVDTNATDQADLNAALQQVNRILLGKPDKVQLAFCCLLADGHLLIEDIPGVGKTTLAHALAKTLGTRYQRIQFTSDMLPADILGVSVYRRDKEAFEFHPGPIFSELILADEVNRATPKTQSALLEAMAEKQVTVDGTTHTLTSPFFVIATQNPVDMNGTFPLPDSQLDRFLLCIDLGYPDQRSERELLQSGDRADMIASLSTVLSPSTLIRIQQAVKRVDCSEALLDYVQALVNQSRQAPNIRVGLSPRAALALVRCGQANAYLEQRNFVTPEDIKAVFSALAKHRLQLGQDSNHTAAEAAEQLLEEVSIP